MQNSKNSNVFRIALFHDGCLKLTGIYSQTSGQLAHAHAMHVMHVLIRFIANIPAWLMPTCRSKLTPVECQTIVAWSVLSSAFHKEEGIGHDGVGSVHKPDAQVCIARLAICCLPAHSKHIRLLWASYWTFAVMLGSCFMVKQHQSLNRC